MDKIGEGREGEREKGDIKKKKKQTSDFQRIIMACFVSLRSS